MPVSLPLLPTSLVGSYAQPEWLIDRKKLAGRFPPRVRAKELWRGDAELLVEGGDDATMGAPPELGASRPASVPKSGGGSPPNGLARRRTTRPGSPSSIRSAPVSISSLTARCGAR